MLFMDWQEYGVLLEKLAMQISVSQENNFDCIVGIPRGGLPVAVYLSHHLKVEMFGKIPGEELIGKKILLVDDISDRGDTLKEWVERLESAGNEVTTATVAYKKTSKFRPSFYAEEIDKWIVFPYEVGKD